VDSLEPFADAEGGAEGAVGHDARRVGGVPARHAERVRALGAELGVDRHPLRV
jgi:hypothetical protein